MRHPGSTRPPRRTDSAPEDQTFDWWVAPPVRGTRKHRRRHAAPKSPPPPRPEQQRRSQVYRQVHEGEEFREIRARYRGFVFPACALFLGWYLLYVVGAAAAPRLMDRRIAGPFTLAWLLGLLQYASTFLLAWLYARHARLKRDRAALGLRWDTQDRLR